MFRPRQKGGNAIERAEGLLKLYLPLSGNDKTEQMTDILADLWLVARQHELSFVEMCEVAEMHGLMEWKVLQKTAQSKTEGVTTSCSR